jgi:hypothetical protein
MKSSSVKLTGCEHVFNAFDPYHPFPLSLQAIILTKVSSVTMMKCTYTSVLVLVNLARLYRSKQGCGVWIDDTTVIAHSDNDT